MMFRNDMYKELKVGTIENSIAISKANICAEALKNKIEQKCLIARRNDNEEYGLDLLLILIGYISNKHKVYCLGDGVERLKIYGLINDDIVYLAITHIDKQCYYLNDEYEQRKNILSTIVNYDEYGFECIAEQINLNFNELQINRPSKEDFKITSFIYELLALGNIYEIFKVILTENFLSNKEKAAEIYYEGLSISAECNGNIFIINIVNGELIYKNKKYEFENWSNYDLENSFTFITNCIGGNIYLKAFIGGAMGPSYNIKIYENNILYNSCGSFGDDKQEELIRVSDEELIEFKYIINELKMEKWKKEYVSKDIIMDGTSWSIYLYLDDKFIKSSGSNSYPKSFNKFCRVIKKFIGREFS